MFCEGLDGYDVKRANHSGAKVFRPSQASIDAGWKPNNAVHLQGPEYDRREAQAMYDDCARREAQARSDYYALRTLRSLGF
jgi:hypothetical protein